MIAIGDVVGLTGELGAGKTTLVRGLLRELGHDGEVRSPTFNLIQEFDTEPPVCHVDLYRLETPKEVADLGLSDYFQSFATIIEWPERGQIDATIHVRLSIAPDGGRDASVEG